MPFINLVTASHLVCLNQQSTNDINQCITEFESQLDLIANDVSINRQAGVCCSLTNLKECLTEIDGKNKCSRNSGKSSSSIGQFINSIIENLTSDVVNIGCGYDLRKSSNCISKYNDMSKALLDAKFKDRKMIKNGIYKSLLAIFVGYRS